MSWLRKILPSQLQGQGSKKEFPEGVWIQCPACQAALYQSQLERNMGVCHKCSYHLRIGARTRLQDFLDENDREEIGVGIESVDRLKFRDAKRYKDRLVLAQKKTGERTALIVVRGCLKQMPVVAAAFEFGFIGGSMDWAVGEKFVCAVEQSVEHKIPLVCFCTSGGARMQEGIFSLLQMSKTSAALARLSRKRIPYISVLADPTTGGVSASLAMLGDVIIAEPRALIGFAGPRVIEQTVRETLPDGFQSSEFLLEHGAVDMILDRRDMRDKIYQLLYKMTFYSKNQEQ